MKRKRKRQGRGGVLQKKKKMMLLLSGLLSIHWPVEVLLQLPLKLP